MRIALITGASSGLGREYARWASEHGGYDQIWAVARRRERLEKLASELSTPVRLVPLDLTEKSSITQLKGLLDEAAAQDTARGEKFSVGLLVNAAGLGKFGTYADMTCEEVNVYAASKAFVRSYTRALRFELRGRGISVTAVCPLWVKTEFIDVARQTANGQTVRHPFPVLGARRVLRWSMLVNAVNYPIATCCVTGFLMRVADKIIPAPVIMWIWEGVRRI